MQLLLTIELEDDPIKALQQVKDSFEGVVMGIRLLKQNQEHDEVAGNIYNENSRKQIGRMSLQRRHEHISIN